MVLWHKTSHSYRDIDFHKFSIAFLNRYPNPFASHILSIDILDISIPTPSNNNNDNNSTLKLTRMIKKSGKLPQWVKPFLGKINQSIILEILYINKDEKYVKSYTKNLDHTKIIQVEEYSTYQYNELSESIDVDSQVKFTSGFNGYKSTSSSINNSLNKFNLFNIDLSAKIEKWSHSKFADNLNKTRSGMNYVLENFSLLNYAPSTSAAAVTSASSNSNSINNILANESK